MLHEATLERNVEDTFARIGGLGRAPEDRAARDDIRLMRRAGLLGGSPAP